MSTALTATQAFQEKMFERIRDSIGDLLSEEDLKRITEAAINKAFFQERITQDNYGHIREQKPALFIELMTELVRKRVSEAVAAWVEAHPEEIKKAIDDVIARGIVGIVISHFESRASWPLQQFAQTLREKGVL